MMHVTTLGLACGTWEEIRHDQRSNTVTTAAAGHDEEDKEDKIGPRDIIDVSWAYR